MQQQERRTNVEYTGFSDIISGFDTNYTKASSHVGVHFMFISTNLQIKFRVSPTKSPNPLFVDKNGRNSPYI